MPARLRPSYPGTRSLIDTPTETQQQPSARQIHSLIGEALPVETSLTPLKGFKLDLTANPGFQKVFFAARCDCGTAGLLSVEVSPEKTLEELKRAVPELARRLLLQAESFYSMPCEAHAGMRMGSAQVGTPGKQGR